MDRVVIFAALQWECRAVLGGLRNLRRDRVESFTSWYAASEGTEVIVVKTGVGVDRAAAAAAAVGDLSRFALMVSAGCAGGLDPTLLPGDLVLATALNGDGARGSMPTDARYRADAMHVAAKAGLRTVEGPVVCSATVLATATEKRAAAAAGAIAVDMEGAPVAAAAAARGVPVLSVRTVLDGAEHAVVVPPGLINPVRGSVRPLATAAYFAMHPRAALELRALRRLQDAAHESLERFFAHWLPRVPDLLRREVG